MVASTDGFTAVTGLLTFVGGVAAAAALVSGIGRSARRFLHWTDPHGADALAEAETTPLGQAAAHVTWLRRQAAMDDDGLGWPNPRPILFVVDELDRCGADVVVEVLDSIHTLMRSDVHRGRAGPSPLAPVAFLVLADAAWVRQAYQAVHEGQAGALTDGVTLGTQFHAKLFNLVVRLPPVTPSQHLHYAVRTLSQLTGTSRAEAYRAIVDPAPVTDGGGDRAPAAAGGDGAAAPPPPPRSPRERLLEHGWMRPPDSGAGPPAGLRGPGGHASASCDRGPHGPPAPQPAGAEAGRQRLDGAGPGPRPPPPAECLVDDHMIRWVILAQAWPDLADRLLTAPGLDRPETVELEAVLAHLDEPLASLVRTKAVARVWPMITGDGDDQTLDLDLVTSVAKLAGQYPPAPGTESVEGGEEASSA